jgi:sensor histidine kinase regulating citrate/malate metabolism
MSDSFSSIRDAISSSNGVISLIALILAVIAIILAAYSLILIVRMRKAAQRQAAAQMTNTNELVSTLSHLSNRLDRPN